jgi:type IV secretion system protein VirD4
MATERALGVSFIYAAQTWRQLAAVFGEQEARALFGLTNVLVMFGGSKNGAFNQEISDLVGQTRVSRTSWQTGAMAGRTFSGEDIAIIRPEEIRQLPERHALVIAENGKPIIARLSRCIDGKTGAPLLAGQAGLRAQLADRYSTATTAEARAAVALVEARRRGIVADPGSDR